MDEGNILAVKEIPLTLRETAGELAETVAREAPGLLEGVLRRVAGEYLTTDCTDYTDEKFPTKNTNGTKGTKNIELKAALEGMPQVGEASYCTKIGKDAGLIDWSRSAEEIDAQVRAYNPRPLAYTTRKGETLFILESSIYKNDSNAEAATSRFTIIAQGAKPGTVLNKDPRFGILVKTGGGLLGITRLQYGGRKALDWKAFLNGERGFMGGILGI
jgi:methionyl-tRNA formyltransferase